MKVQIASDLHSEFEPDGLKTIASKVIEPVGDVLVLAGDIVVGRNRLYIRENIQFLTDRFKQVIHVPGNHEYYGSSFDEVNENLAWAESQISNYHVLNRKIVEIEGKRFMGGTLWFPQKPDPQRAWELMNDFDMIKGFRPRVYSENELTVKFLLDNCRKGDFVVTHHLPMMRCVHPNWGRAATNMFYVGDADEVLVTKEPAFWVHGHTHEKMDNKHFETRVICNPRGYRGQRRTNDAFDPKLVVEY